MRSNSGPQITGRLSSILLLVLSWSSYAVAQSTGPVEASLRSRPSLPAAEEIRQPIDDKRTQAVSYVRSLADRTFSFQAVGPRVNTLIEFGDLLWKHDEEYARGLFLKNLASLKSVLPSDRQDPDAQKNGQSITSADRSRLRARIITHLAVHDPALALKLGDEENTPIDSINNLRAASNVLDRNGSSKLAVRFAERSIGGGDISSWSLNMVGFLQKLRRTNETSADELYQKTLHQLEIQPAASANDVLTIGTYVFTSPVLEAASPQTVNGRDGMIVLIEVGPALSVDITANRQGVSVDSIRRYLHTATRVLLRSNFTGYDSDQDLAALRLLLPKARAFLPEITPLIATRIHSLAGPSKADETALERHRSGDSLDVDAELEATDRLSDVERDEKLLSITFALVQSGKFDRALKITRQISDLSGRDKLLNAVRFAEGTSLLQAEKLGEVEEIAEKLATGPGRAILWLSISAAYARKGNQIQGSEMLRRAVQECQRLGGDGRRPYLLLNAAALYTKVEPESAMIALREAVNSFNGSEKLYAAWAQTIQIGDIQREFPLLFKGFDKSFQLQIKQLHKHEPEATLGMIFTLKDESLKGDALVGISRNVLESIALNTNQ